MAFYSVDQSGNMIQSDILTAGYIRQNIENDMNNKIPSELYQLCFEYWLHKVCDLWTTEFYEENNQVEINGDEIIALYNNNHALTLYGSHIVKDGSFYDWKIRMNEFGFKIGTWKFVRKSHNPNIGIIVNNEEILREYSNNANWAFKGNGYCVKGGKLELTYGGHEEDYVDAVTFNDDNDIIIVHLDLVNYTLGFTINDKYCGIAFRDIKPNDYRLAISLVLRVDESKFQFL